MGRHLCPFCLINESSNSPSLLGQLCSHFFYKTERGASFVASLIKPIGNESFNIKKMSYFRGRSFCFCFLVMMFFLQTLMAEEENGNPLYQLSTREELVQMAGYGEEKLSTVLVTGTVLCEACLHGEDLLRSWPISGALVTVYCHNSHRRTISKTQALTDEYGDFMIDLPSHLHAIPHLEKLCSVKVLRIPKNSLCRPAYVYKNRGLTLSSVGNGIRTYATGQMRFLHQTSKPLHACNGKGSSEKQIAW